MSLIAPALRPFCSSAPGLYATGDRLAEADVVILAASWDRWVVKQLPETLAEIRKVSKARILVVNRKSFGPIEVRKYLDMPLDQRLAVRNPMRADVVSINAELAAAAGADVIDVPGLVCGGTNCPVFTDDGRLISYDGFHYTPDGAKEVGRLMFADARLSGLR